MAGECEHLAKAQVQVTCEGTLLRHVHQDSLLNDGVNPHPNSFYSGVHSLQDGCSVDLLCMTSARQSRIVLGLQKRGKPDAPWVGYKDPTKFRLFELRVQDVLAIAEMSEVVHSPSNMLDPLWRGRPRNEAHCLVRPSKDVKDLVLLADIARPHECPDVTDDLLNARSDSERVCIENGTMGP